MAVSPKGSGNPPPASSSVSTDRKNRFLNRLDFGTGSSLNLAEQLRTFFFLMDELNRAQALPVVLVGAQADPLGSVIRAQTIAGNLADNFGGGSGIAAVYNLAYKFNGTTFDRDRVATVQTASAGASALTILAAGGVGVKNRIFGILIGSNNAGVVVINDISGGISTNVAAGASNFIPFPPNGVVQTTANTAITATLAAATLSAVVLSGPS